MDFGGNAFGFMIIVLAGPNANRFAVAMLTPEFFQMHVRVFLDQLVGAAQNAPGATVVLFELDHLQVRIILAEQIQIFRLRATPCIDALVIVADAGHIAFRACKMAQQTILRAISVLAFVDQQIAKAFAPGRCQVFILIEQHQRNTNQVIKINCIEGLQTCLIAIIQIGGFAFARASSSLKGLFGREAVVFRFRNQAVQGLQGIVLQTRR